MKVVLDTNVLIAALITDGLCRQVKEDCDRKHNLVTSEYILRELEEKMAAKFPPRRTWNQAIRQLRLSAERVDPSKLEEPVCRDPDDDWILATAKEGNAGIIVTGDNDLLILKEFENILIIPPRSFLELTAP